MSSSINFTFFLRNCFQVVRTISSSSSSHVSSSIGNIPRSIDQTISRIIRLSEVVVQWSHYYSDSIKGPVINAKEQRKCVVSILELTSLDNTNSQVCPVRHLATYIRASKGRIKISTWHDDSDTESEQSDDESSNNVDVPTDYQLSDTLLGQYKHMVNNQGLLVEEANHKVATCGVGPVDSRVYLLETQNYG
ncbi:hypothetical protein ACTFIR_009425 [Dictyostelium discoideum]